MKCYEQSGRGELLGQLAQVGHGLVQRVTVVGDGAGRMSGDLQLALKERNSVGEGWNLGQCDVGDLLRHNIWLKGELTARPTRVAVPPLQTYNGRRKIIINNTA